jgi:SAM-dependent methyltransferase
LSAKKFPTPYGLALARWGLIEGHLESMSGKEITVLDVGAGYGFFGVLASQSSQVKQLKYIAVEPDESLHHGISDMWESMDSHSSVQTFCRIEDVEGEVDILVLSHVLEHVPNPLEFLRLALGYLKDGGLLFIDVPYHDQRFKSDVFPHLYFFTPENLNLILKKLRLEAIDVDAWGHQFWVCDSSGYWRKSFFSYLDRLVHFMLNHHMPLVIGVRYFLKRFGIAQRIKGGVWVRALARKPI